MTVSCAIVIDRLEDGRYRATCPVFPDLEVVADTEAAAREGMEATIGHVLRRRLGEGEPPTGEPIL
jgi:hypothetical protein